MEPTGLSYGGESNSDGKTGSERKMQGRSAEFYLDENGLALLLGDLW
jgi:hypothetical protein